MDSFADHDSFTFSGPSAVPKNVATEDAADPFHIGTFDDQPQAPTLSMDDFSENFIGSHEDQLSTQPKYLVDPCEPQEFVPATNGFGIDDFCSPKPEFSGAQEDFDFQAEAPVSKTVGVNGHNRLESDESAHGSASQTQGQVTAVSLAQERLQKEVDQHVKEEERLKKEQREIALEELNDFYAQRKKVLQHKKDAKALQAVVEEKKASVSTSGVGPWTRACAMIETFPKQCLINPTPTVPGQTAPALNDTFKMKRLILDLSAKEKEEAAH